MRASSLAIAFIIVIAPAIILPLVWPLAGLGAGEDDVMYYLPARVFFHECVQRGEWPWINPLTGMGRPFMADPQSAVWYPATWLFALLPPLPAYAAHVWLHHVIAAWGMYRLLRSEQGGDDTSAFAGRGRHGAGERISRPAALFGAIVFAFCGFILAHRVHLTIHAGAAWAPWVFWRTARLADRLDWRRLLSAVCVASLQTLSGHFQIAAMTAIGSVVWLLARRSAVANTAQHESDSSQTRPSLGRVGLCWFAVWICTAFVCAIQLWPTLAYVRECDRGDRDYFAFTENSWAPASLATFVLPFAFGNRTDNSLLTEYYGPSHQAEQFAYVGILPLLLAGFALLGGWRTHPTRRAWVVLLAFSILLAVGRFGPICPLLYFIPGANVFRVPARAMMLADLALCGLAARVLHEMIAQPLSPRVARTLDALGHLSDRLPVVVACLIIPPVGVALFYLFSRSGLDLVHVAKLCFPTAIAAVIIFASVRALRAVFHARQRQELPGVEAGMVKIQWVMAIILCADIAWVGANLDIPRGVQTAREMLTSVDRDLIVAEIGREPPASNSWLAPRLWVVNVREEDRFGEYEQPVSKLCADSNLLTLLRTNGTAPLAVGAPTNPRHCVSTLNDYGPMQPRAFGARVCLAPGGYTPPARRQGRGFKRMAVANVGGC
ncbi:MAG: hypothetical protein JNG88_17500 [Phycisphaerales bacterium]|nr:hypothetical protein [Phycisphaerales bacterium]